jgi:uncharacterized sulfatase
VQDQSWKLIEAVRPKKDWLFNLAIDPTEKTNLADKEPQKLAQLKALMLAHHAKMPAPLWDTFVEMSILIDKTSDQKPLPDDEYAYWYN